MVGDQGNDHISESRIRSVDIEGTEVVVVMKQSSELVGVFPDLLLSQFLASLCVNTDGLDVSSAYPPDLMKSVIFPRNVSLRGTSSTRELWMIGACWAGVVSDIVPKNAKKR